MRKHILKKKIHTGEVILHDFPSICEALGFIPCTTKKKKQSKKILWTNGNYMKLKSFCTTKKWSLN
jgi:hypothetical protein